MKLGLLMLSVVVGVSLAVQAEASDSKRIVVTAFAEKAIEPDILHMNVEIWSKSSTAQKAQSLAAAEHKRIAGLLDQNKIKKEDIRTEFYNFGPEYVWDSARNQNRMEGYKSTQTLRVTVRKVDQAGKLIDSLIVSDKAGSRPEFGTSVGALQWDTSKRDELEKASLAEAVKVARQKADEIASAAGVKIKSVHRIVYDSNPDFAGPRPYEMKARAAALSADAMGTTVAEGQIKVRVGVSGEYSF